MGRSTQLSKESKEEESKSEIFEAAKKAYLTIDEKFGKDIVMLDISGVSVLADYFLIASGGTPNQLKAIAEAAEKVLFEHGIRLRHTEGYQSSKWILLDFSSIIIHLFNKDDREFYNLERIWGDAAVIPEELIRK